MLGARPRLWRSLLELLAIADRCFLVKWFFLVGFEMLLGLILAAWVVIYVQQVQDRQVLYYRVVDLVVCSAVGNGLGR